MGDFDFAASVEIKCSADELVALKRLLRSWLKSRKQKRFAGWLRRSSKFSGFCVFGMGDEGATVTVMLAAAGFT